MPSCSVCVLFDYDLCCDRVEETLSVCGKKRVRESVCWWCGMRKRMHPATEEGPRLRLFLD